MVIVRLQRARGVLDLYLLLLDDQVRCHEAPGYLAAVGAVAEMAAPTSEELWFVYRDANGATQAIPRETLLEFGHGMVFWVSLW